MSKELKELLHTKGVATSRTTSYHSTENAQAERYNQTILKTVLLFTKTNNLPSEEWEINQ